MTQLINNFDEGPHGTVVTAANSGFAENNPFDVCTTQPAGCIFQYKDAALLGRPTAEYVLHCKTGSTAANVGAAWTTSMGTQTEIWVRFYIRLDVLPTTAQNLSIFVTDNGVTYTGAIEVRSQPGSEGSFRIVNGPVTVSAVTTAELVAGQWARVEARFLYSTTVGQGELKLFLEPDSDTPTETTSFTGANMGAASSNSYSTGYLLLKANQPDLYLSGLELNNTDWPGPAPFKTKGVPGIQPNPIAIHNW